MNRRSFLASLSALPVIGRLFTESRAEASPPSGDFEDFKRKCLGPEKPPLSDEQIGRCRESFEAFRVNCFNPDPTRSNWTAHCTDLCEINNHSDATARSNWTVHTLANIGTHHIGILDYPGSGKSVWAMQYALWRLGNDPNLRIGFVSEYMSLAASRLEWMCEQISINKQVLAVFPELLIDEMRSTGGLPRSITVFRQNILRDPSVCAYSLRQKLSGRRYDLTVFDDVISGETAMHDWMRVRASRDLRVCWMRKLKFRTGRAIMLASVLFHPLDIVSESLCDARFQWHIGAPVLQTADLDHVGDCGSKGHRDRCAKIGLLIASETWSRDRVLNYYLRTS